MHFMQVQRAIAALDDVTLLQIIGHCSINAQETRANYASLDRLLPTNYRLTPPNYSLLPSYDSLLAANDARVAFEERKSG